MAGDKAPPADAPLMVVGRDGAKRLVTAADAAALGLGVRVGMPAAKAQALVAGLTIRDADPVGDAEALERLAVWVLQRIAPIVAADNPDGIVIDSTGADHLHGGEAAMLTAMVQRFASSGIEARAAIADSWGVAHAAARFVGRQALVIPPGESVPLLRPLPLAALRLDVETVAGLRTLGFETIGDLMDQPRAPLALRFGPEIGRRLNQALGLQPEPIDPIRSPELVEVRRVFGEPIGAAETIARYAGKLVDVSTAEQNQATRRSNSRPRFANAGDRREGVARAGVSCIRGGFARGFIRAFGRGFGRDDSCRRSSREC
jgi:protein ImuB